MRKRLTQTLVKGLKPAASRYEVFDTEIKGMLLRVTPAGIKTYSVRYRTDDGRRNRITIGPADVLTPAQARDRARQLLGQVADVGSGLLGRHGHQLLPALSAAFEPAIGASKGLQGVE